MATTFRSLKTTGTAVFAGAVTAAAITMSGALTGTTASFTGTVGTTGTFSGETLQVGTGITVGDNDGSGCTRIQASNGTVSGKSVTCP